ncbi:MAG: hypothetical protein ABSE06_12660 [Anaerolineaceae bacterium]|jgi:hypothetical protein
MSFSSVYYPSQWSDLPVVDRLTGVLLAQVHAQPVQKVDLKQFADQRGQVIGLSSTYK